ncbi:hypothetical protein TIFTF001_028745 [Ficus carica]|uniref:Uncharacterized protein n=1 Tax=Ficus carica TaxID=3494 RepID=A0AA88DQH8_FICCA|nr:hypothetical protein TIFTF001_028745 [Ficus carica]
MGARTIIIRTGRNVVGDDNRQKRTHSAGDQRIRDSIECQSARVQRRDDKRREWERGGQQSSEEEGEDNGHLGAWTAIVRRGERRQRALGCIEKGRMDAGTSIIKRERAHGCWDGNHQE